MESDLELSLSHRFAGSDVRFGLPSPISIFTAKPPSFAKSAKQVTKGSLRRARNIMRLFHFLNKPYKVSILWRAWRDFAPWRLILIKISNPIAVCDIGHQSRLRE